MSWTPRPGALGGTGHHTVTAGDAQWAAFGRPDPALPGDIGPQDACPVGVVSGPREGGCDEHTADCTVVENEVHGESGTHMEREKRTAAGRSGCGRRSPGGLPCRPRPGPSMCLGNKLGLAWCSGVRQAGLRLRADGCKRSAPSLQTPGSPGIV